MYITPQRMRYFIFLLAGCITFSSSTALLADETASETMYEERLSDRLKSPLRSDLKHVSNYWLENYGYNGLNPTKEEALIAYNNKLLLPVMAHGYTQEDLNPASRLNLLKSLQFLNLPGKKSVLNGLAKPFTKSGEISLFNLLAQEVTDWKIIKNRQKFIKLLIQNPELLSNIQESLQAIKENEPQFLDALNRANEILRKQKVHVMSYRQNKEPLDIVIEGLIILIKELAKSSDNINNLLEHARTWTYIHTTWISALAAFVAFKQAAQKWLSPEARVGWSLGGLAATGTSFLFYKLLMWRREELFDLFGLAQSMAQICRHGIQLHEDVSQNKESEAYYIDLFGNASPEWKIMEKKINTSTFDESSEPTTLFTHHGRIENTLIQITKTYNELGIISRFSGELDAYQAIAQFYLDNQKTQNANGENIRCCLVDFVDDSEESILHAKNFWHPIIGKDVVRPSSLMLGGAEENPRNLVITGPNAGGKSVNLKSLLVNLILAQTFGIACAESFKFTPFKKVIARLESTDDTAGDKSKFMLEAIGMTNLLKEMMSLKAHEHAFVETDELFTGTEVGPAISLSIELCSQIAGMKNVMYLLATHYKELADLKRVTKNVFDNYRVNVFKDPINGKLMYPYSLSQGIGNTNVAFDIFLDQLKSQGIENPILIDIINRAKNRQEAIEAELEKNRIATENVAMISATA